MPCPASPEPDGFHRYQLAPQGDSRDYVTRCVYCGEEKTVHPSEQAATIWDHDDAARRERARAASAATKRRKGTHDG